MTLAQKALSGVIWNFSEQLLKRGVGAFVSILLAKFLVPDDFALIAMMSIFLVIANNLMESGLNLALIRLNRPEQLEFNTAFIANIFLGCFSYLLLFFIAPFAADFYLNPSLTLLIRITGIGVIINSFSVVQLTIFRIKLDFRTSLKASFPAGIFSGLIAIFLAYSGYGVWALIAQMLVASVTNNLLLWYFSDWRPNRTFSWKICFELFSFSYKFVLANFSNIFFSNLYVVVVSKLFISAIAGQFYYAERIRDLVLMQIVNSIQNVSYPVLASLQHDKNKLFQGLRQVLSCSAFLLNPLFIFVVFSCRSLFQILFGQNWAEAAHYLQFLSVDGLLYPLHLVNINALVLKGRSDYVLILEIIKKTTILIGLIVGSSYGVFGILISQIICSILAYLPNTYFSSKVTSYNLQHQLKDFFPSLFLSIAAAVITYFVFSLFSFGGLVDFILRMIFYFCLYFALSYQLELESFKILKIWIFRKQTKI